MRRIVTASALSARYNCFIPFQIGGIIIRRVLSLCIALGLLLSLAVQTRADYSPEVDYMERMLDAAVRGDTESGQSAQLCRDEKIDADGLDYPHVQFDELLLLSKIIEAEAGSEWLSDEWKMAVGEVVLNRIASPEFPDTMAEVVCQPGQYYGKNSRYFNSLLPSRRSAEAAARLLSGERVLGEPSVVFQANFVLGGGVFLRLDDKQLGSTYLCYSSHRELYNG